MQRCVRLFGASALLFLLSACSPTPSTHPPMPPGFQPGGDKSPRPTGSPQGKPNPGGMPARPQPPDPEAMRTAFTELDAKPLMAVENGSQVMVGVEINGEKASSEALTKNLPTLMNVPGLKQLSFHQTRLTEEMISDIAKQEKLEELDFATMPVTAAELKSLASMKALKKLELDTTGLSAAGLKELEACKPLKVLVLKNEKGITDADVAALKKALPDLQVTR